MKLFSLSHENATSKQESKQGLQESDWLASVRRCVLGKLIGHEEMVIETDRHHWAHCPCHHQPPFPRQPCPQLRPRYPLPLAWWPLETQTSSCWQVNYQCQHHAGSIKGDGACIRTLSCYCLHYGRIRADRDGELLVSQFVNKRPSTLQ